MRSRELSLLLHNLHNKYSLKSFLDLGYEIKKDKLKYGGLRRYVVAKELQK